ncbi:MAG: primosomal protein N' [Gammaproteobacteria bacterium]|nr:primosomal protein N' [Gammaproteobacteria bacterium]
MGSQSAPLCQYVRVAVPAPLRRAFDYLSSYPGLAPGMRVRVPFGRGNRIGVVLECNIQPDRPDDKLKAVGEVLDNRPLLNRELLQLLQWSAAYYHHPVGEVIATALPGPLRKGLPAVRQTRISWLLTDLGRNDGSRLLARAPAQQALLNNLLAGSGKIERDDPLLSSDRNRRALNGLVAKALVVRELRPLTLGEPQPAPSAERTPLELNPAQAEAVREVNQGLKQFRVHLLDGVTGSGKTEVYLQTMAAVCAAGGQCLLLVPEISLTTQTLERIKARVAGQVYSIHSGRSESERLEAWLAAANGDAAVVIGTRSALFTPFRNLGLILVDEEHDLSYKQQENFRYHARDLAIKRAQLNQIPIVLGSATPSLESAWRADSGSYNRLLLPQRAGAALPPSIRCIDVRNTPLDAGLSPALIESIEQHLEAEHQVLLFLNRRGYAPVYYCHRCGWTTRCNACDATLTFHRRHNRLLCHHCGASAPLPQSCGDCGATELLLLGAGTERLEEALLTRFPDHGLVRIDQDMTRAKGALTKRLDAIRSGAPRILVGTQMLTKGHHFPGVTLVGVLDADQGLYSTDVRATERLAQMLLQVAGRAGRAENRGEVLVQTHQPEHPLFNQLFEQGYAAFCQTELAERRAALLPPFSQLALFRAESSQVARAENFLNRAADLLRQSAGKEIQVLGPLPAPMEKRQGRYRMQLVVQAPRHRTLHQLLGRVLPLLDRLPRGQRLRWSLDIDPMDLY